MKPRIKLPTQPDNMQNSLFGITMICFFLVVATGCHNEDQQSVIRKQNVDSAAGFILRKGEVNKQISFPAELTPIERADIFPKVSGYVSSIKVDIGDKVRKGQTLAILEAPELTANYSQANADLQTVRSKYLGSLDAYDRILNASKVEGTIAAGGLERAKSQMMADSASLEAARSKVVAYKQLKDYLVIVSPYEGLVTQRNVDPGTLVGNNNSKPILVVENTSSLRLRIPVPEVYTTAASKTEDIFFTVDAQPGVKFKAKLSRKAGALSQANRTETWEFIYPNKDQLKSGMFANATLQLGRKDSSFLVPPTAVATSLEKKFVIRVKEGKAVWVDVRTGINQGDKVEIFGEVKEGDSLLTRATDETKVNTPVVLKIQH